MSQKDKCKEFMSKTFGPATANLVEAMDESTCVQQCRERIRSFIGDDKVTEFDSFINS